MPDTTLTLLPLPSMSVASTTWVRPQAQGQTGLTTKCSASESQCTNKERVWKGHFLEFSGHFFSIQSPFIKLLISQLLGSVLNHHGFLPWREQYDCYKMMGYPMHRLPLPARPFPREFNNAISWMLTKDSTKTSHKKTTKAFQRPDAPSGARLEAASLSFFSTSATWAQLPGQGQNGLTTKCSASECQCTNKERVWKDHFLEFSGHFFSIQSPYIKLSISQTFGLRSEPPCFVALKWTTRLLQNDGVSNA